LVPQLEAEGYQVYSHPKRSLLPTFIENYIPDAIAFGPEKNLVIEIKGRPDTPGTKQLARIAEMFKDQEKWEFRVIYASSFDQQSKPGILKPNIISNVLAEIQTLAKSSHFKAALLFGWATIEAIGRALLEKQFETPQTPTRLLQVLASEGYVTPSEADRLRVLAEMRNRLAHGSIDLEITKEDIEFFCGILESLASMLDKSPSSDINLSLPDLPAPRFRPG